MSEAPCRTLPCHRCLKLILSAGITVLVFYLLYRPKTPRYYLTAFSVDATNASFQLEIENKNHQMGILHDDINVTLRFLPNLKVGVAVIPSFYQGHQKTADKDGVVAAYGVVAASGDRAPWAAAVRSGTAVFRVGVESAFRYKVLSWKSPHHAVSLVGDVAVDVGGKKSAEKGIRLSNAAFRGVDCLRCLVTVVLICFVLWQ